MWEKKQKQNNGDSGSGRKGKDKGRAEDRKGGREDGEVREAGKHQAEKQSKTEASREPGL